MTVIIRPAVATDYPSFARLSTELAAGSDPTPSQTSFELDYLPTTLFAVGGDFAALGYVYVQIFDGVGYVRHLVTDPTCRRLGIGRALMEAARAMFLKAGAGEWCLNVIPTNTPAVALYESLGMSKRYLSIPLKLGWGVVDALPASSAVYDVAEPSSAMDTAFEERFFLIPGQLKTERQLPRRKIVAALRGTEVFGVAVFKIDFPGASPFRVTNADAIRPLLEGVKKWAEHDHLHLMIENDPASAEVLLRAGAVKKFDIVHLRGALAVRPQVATWPSAGP